MEHAAKNDAANDSRNDRNPHLVFSHLEIDES